jgi:hypothetical protein
MHAQSRRDGTTANTPRTSGQGMAMPGERLARNGAGVDR